MKNGVFLQILDKWISLVMNLIEFFMLYSPCHCLLLSLSFSYGLVWISTTLVFVIASLGNCATYLMNNKGNSNNAWAFDVNYVNVAAGSIYGYALIVPLGYYFLLQYLGASVSLVRFWCLWGYSLFIFILTSVSISVYHSSFSNFGV